MLFNNTKEDIKGGRAAGEIRDGSDERVSERSGKKDEEE